jgi:type IV secretory pathway VirB10-like protein
VPTKYERNLDSSVRPIEAPSGLDLHPRPRRTVRVSKRTTLAVVCLIALLLLGFAYGGYRRTLKQRAASREAGLPKSPTPATQASNEIVQSIPAGSAPLARNAPTELHPPEETSRASVTENCGSDPTTGKAYRYNPQTGQPCDGLAQERVVVRQSAPVRTQPAMAPVAHQETTPEEQRIIAAYQREQEAIVAPTGVRDANTGNTSSNGTSVADTNRPLIDNSADETDLTKVLNSVAGANTAARTATSPSLFRGDTEYESQNTQMRKDAFLAAARSRDSDDYLRSTRQVPLSRYEVKAGWEIPTVLEQSLNSDLPGELKALVTSNVYDTATGLYLVIPQGSRLIGKYDSRISYGQDGVQVAWNRVIFPDGSSIDLDGMVGLDSHGNAGLRDKVDHHYRRLLGFSVLTSMFTAAFEISQRQNQSAVAYPTPGQAASSAVGQELSQTGSQIIRRNLYAQPTIKVPAGYRFTVRVNHDILFDAPYEPLNSDPDSVPERKQLWRRSSLPAK